MYNKQLLYMYVYCTIIYKICLIQHNLFPNGLKPKTKFLKFSTIH